jgi:hypothetical protein
VGYELICSNRNPYPKEEQWPQWALDEVGHPDDNISGGLTVTMAWMVLMFSSAAMKLTLL